MAGILFTLQGYFFILFKINSRDENTFMLYWAT